MQLNHYNSNFKKKKFPITLVCDNVNNAPNIGSLFRIADALGVEELVFCGHNISLGKRMKRTSRSTEKYVSHRIIINILEVIHELKSKDYTIIALEITAKSELLKDLIIDPKRPIALVIGNENLGISDEVLDLVDIAVHINMFGENSSMNVVQATSIAIYELTKRLS